MTGTMDHTMYELFSPGIDNIIYFATGTPYSKLKFAVAHGAWLLEIQLCADRVRHVNQFSPPKCYAVLPIAYTNCICKLNFTPIALVESTLHTTGVVLEYLSSSIVEFPVPSGGVYGSGYIYTALVANFDLFQPRPGIPPCHTEIRL